MPPASPHRPEQHQPPGRAGGSAGLMGIWLSRGEPAVPCMICRKGQALPGLGSVPAVVFPKGPAPAAPPSSGMRDVHKSQRAVPAVVLHAVALTNVREQTQRAWFSWERRGEPAKPGPAVMGVQPCPFEPQLGEVSRAGISRWDCSSA